MRDLLRTDLNNISHVTLFIEEGAKKIPFDEFDRITSSITINSGWLNDTNRLISHILDVTIKRKYMSSIAVRVGRPEKAAERRSSLSNIGASLRTSKLSPTLRIIYCLFSSCRDRIPILIAFDKLAKVQPKLKH
jgi:hypothetical protein